MRIVLLFAALLVGISACKHKDNIPNGIFPKDQMQSVLWDVMQAEAYTGARSTVKSDTLINSVADDARFQEEVFSIHHISREDFYKSYAYYKEHTDLLIPVLDSITAQENRKENIQQALKAKARAKIDSAKISVVNNKNLLSKPKSNPPIDSTGLKNKHKKTKIKKPVQKKYFVRSAP